MSYTRGERERAAPRVQGEESHRSPAAARLYARPARDGKGKDGAPAEHSPVLGLLAARGISPGQIAAIAAGAGAQGVTAGDYLIGNGYVAADTLYRSIARHLGVPFLDGRLPLRDGVDPHEAGRLGIAALVPDQAARARIVLAPRGAALEQFMHDMRSAENIRPGFALTTPERLDHSLRVHAAETVAAAASDGLSEFDPTLSARSGPTVKEIAIASICLAGLIALGLNVPMLAGTGMALLFFSAIILRLFALAQSFHPSASAPPISDADLPIYTIIVALYREEAVVGRLLGALEELDYPRAKLDTKIVVEADDLATIRALRGARAQFPFEIVVAPPGAPRTKPRALNVALPFARGALTCVFDAEDQPAATQLRKAAALFAEAPPDLACLQARLIIDNHADNWLTRLYALDYATLFEVIDPGTAALHLPVPLGGSSNHFRTAVLRDVGGWDAWNVTEDADLGLRLARFEYTVATFDSETLEEAPAALPAFLRQRTRWLKGWMQTLFVNARNPLRLARELSIMRAACTLIGLGSAVVGALLWPLFTVWLFADALYGSLLAQKSAGEILHSTLWCFNAIYGTLALFGSIGMAMQRQSLRELWPSLLLWPIYQGLITIAAWGAALDLWRNPAGPRPNMVWPEVHAAAQFAPT